MRSYGVLLWCHRRWHTFLMVRLWHPFLWNNCTHALTMSWQEVLAGFPLRSHPFLFSSRYPPPDLAILHRPDQGKYSGYFFKTHEFQFKLGLTSSEAQMKQLNPTPGLHGRYIPSAAVIHLWKYYFEPVKAELQLLTILLLWSLEPLSKATCLKWKLATRDP